MFFFTGFRSSGIPSITLIIKSETALKLEQWIKGKTLEVGKCRFGSMSGLFLAFEPSNHLC